MSQNGLMIDYEYCTGCHSCEVACKLEHKLPTGVFGIKLAEDKPFQIDEKTWECKWIPITTQLCDLCKERVSKDKPPSCVLHCCAHCIEYGDLVDLAKKMAGKSSKTVLFSV